MTGIRSAPSWLTSCPGCAGPCAGPPARPTPPWACPSRNWSCFPASPNTRGSGQLARLVRLAPRSVATLLNWLQTAGYVVRTDGAGDRRTVSLHVSPVGAAAVTRWHRVNEDIIAAALVTLSERDRSALRDAAPALRDLTASIDALAD